MLAALFPGGLVRWRVVLALPVVLCLWVARAHAQLRPLEPVDPEVWLGQANLRARVRVTWLNDQRASLAGTIGQLVELGDLSLLVRTGRIVLEFGGTPQRWLSEEERFAAPTGGAHP